eukprot:Hpha_TRINITY_DN15978_c0_g5::TRINITY_DN15978_c0_g5_i1::g.74797::m.74797
MAQGNVHRDAVHGDVLYGTDNYRSHLRAAREGDFTHAHNDREEHLKRVIDRLEDAHSQMQAELTSTKLELSHARDELERRRSERLEVEQREREQTELALTKVREEVRIQVQEQENRSKKLSERLVQKDQELEQRDREVHEKDARIGDLERQNKELERELESHGEHVTDLKALLGDVKSERDDHVQKARRHEDDVGRLGRDLQDREGELHNSREEQRYMKQKLDIANDRVAELERLTKESKSAMEQQKVSHEHSLHLLKQELHQVTHKLSEHRLHTERLDGDAAMKEKTQRELLDELKDKDEVIFKQHAVVVEQQRREQELQDELRALLKQLRERADELRTVDDIILSQTDRIGTKGVGEPFGTPDPRKLIVQCAPVGVPVVSGREVKIYITTVNTNGVPVRGEKAFDFAVNVADVDVGHPEICLPPSVIKANMDAGSPRRTRSADQASPRRAGSPRGRAGAGSPRGGAGSPRRAGSPQRRTAGAGSPRRAPASPGSPRAGDVEVKAPPLLESSTFVKTYYASQEGWTPVAVTYKGHTVHTGFFCYSSEDEVTRDIEGKYSGFGSDPSTEARRERELSLVSQARRADGGNTVTVSIRPPTVHPGDEAEAVVVVRDKDGRPLVGGRDLSADIAVNEMFPVQSEYESLLGPLRQVEKSSVYVASFRIPDKAGKGGSRPAFQWVGVVASLEGAVAGGCCTTLQDGSRKHVPRNTTVVCAPDPVAVGETVTAVLTTRGADLAPTPLEGAQDVLFNIRPSGGADRISPIAPLPGGDGSQWVCTYQASKAGRSGVRFEYAGTHLGGGSVEVLAPAGPDSKRTEVTISPASAAPGQRVCATIRTRDSSGRLAAGPQPAQIHVSAQGASRGVRETPQRGSVDGEYVSEFYVADDARPGDTAGVEVSYQTDSTRANVPVSAQQGEANEDEAGRVVPPIKGGFLRDPVSAGETVELLIQSEGSEPPIVTPIANVKSAEQPQLVPHSSPGVYIAQVVVGTDGTASVQVSTGAERAQLSTTVNDAPLSDLNMEIQRLRTVQLKLKQYGLQPRSASPGAKRVPASPKRSPKAAAKKSVQVVYMHPRFGIEISGPLRAKSGQMVHSQGDALEEDRAKVSAVKTGPCDGKLQSGDTITGIKKVDDPRFTEVVTKDNFDDFRERLGKVKEGESFPALQIRFDRDGRESVVEVTPDGVADKVTGRRVHRGTVRITYGGGTGGRQSQSPQRDHSPGSARRSPARATRRTQVGSGPMTQSSFDKGRSQARSVAKSYGKVG